MVNQKFNTMRVLIILTIILFGCNPSNTQGVKKINTEEMEALIVKAQNLQIVDLRTPGEIEQGYIGNPVFINFSEGNLEEKLGKLDREKPIVIYCAAGGRSGKASKVIVSLGFKTMYDYIDGFNGWATANKPINKR